MDTFTIKIVNCTPHDCHLIVGAGAVTIRQSGMVARVAERMSAPVMLDVDIHGDGSTTIPVECRTRALGEVVGLPGRAPGVLYLVSTMVADAASYRDDLVVPGDLVRDEAGKVIGCRGFYRVAAPTL